MRKRDTLGDTHATLDPMTQQGSSLIADIRAVTQYVHDLSIDPVPDADPVDVVPAANRILEADRDGLLLSRLIAEPLQQFAEKLRVAVEAATREVVDDDGG